MGFDNYTKLSEFTNDLNLNSPTRLSQLNDDLNLSGLSQGEANVVYYSLANPNKYVNYTRLSQWSDDLGRRGLTHLSNFSNDLDLSGFTQAEATVVYYSVSNSLGFFYYTKLSDITTDLNLNIPTRLRQLTDGLNLCFFIAS